MRKLIRKTLFLCVIFLVTSITNRNSFNNFIEYKSGTKVLLIYPNNYFRLSWSEGLLSFDLNGYIKKNGNKFLFERNDIFDFNLIYDEERKTKKIKINLFEKTANYNYSGLVRISNSYFDSIKGMDEFGDLGETKTISLYKGKLNTELKLMNSLNYLSEVQVVINYPNYLINCQVFNGIVKNKRKLIISSLFSNELVFIRIR